MNNNLFKKCKQKPRELHYILFTEELFNSKYPDFNERGFLDESFELKGVKYELRWWKGEVEISNDSHTISTIKQGNVVILGFDFMIELSKEEFEAYFKEI